MNSENMERLIKNLGCSYDHLITNSVIAKLPLQQLYDEDSLEIDLVPGIELIFCPETLRFEVIYIFLKNEDEQDAKIYTGELPSPFDNLENQNDVRRTLGEPLFSKTPMELHGNGLHGWDKYQLPSELHHAALVEFQYGKRMRTINILFSLMDR